METQIDRYSDREGEKMMQGEGGVTERLYERKYVGKGR